MEMFVKKASESDIANKVKADKDWLTKERLDYIVAERPAVFHYLKPEDVDQEAFKESLKKEKALFKFAFVAENNEHWKDFVGESIPRPLTNKIFKEYGVLLNFLKEDEYKDLAKEWLKKIKPNDFIPNQVEKFLDEKQVLNVLKNRGSVSFEHLAEEVKTKDVCVALMERKSIYVRDKFYKSLPKEIQDDADIAMLACSGNKQFYKELTPKAKLHEHVVGYVINNVIPSAGDHDYDHTDHTAIKAKELSIDAILSISSPYTMRDLLRENTALLTNKKIQEKWLSNPKYHEPLSEFLDYFNEENKENFKNKVQKQDNWQKAITLFSTPQLRDMLIDESNVKDSLEILFATHCNSKSFEKALKQTGLKDVLDRNLEQYSKHYGKSSNPISEKGKIIDLADWLVTQNKDEYKQTAFKLLSIVLKKDPNALDVDFEYHYDIKSRALKNIASEVYEYMDNQDANKTTKKKKM